MKSRDQLLAFLNQNKKLFRDRYHIIRIGLFGSFAHGDQNVNSDIDRDTKLHCRLSGGKKRGTATPLLPRGRLPAPN
jgi:hypothetical protein